MAETLGSLCDKLTVVKLKQWHADDDTKRISLDSQEQALKNEIDAFVHAAVTGDTPIEKLLFPSNKIVKSSTAMPAMMGSIGTVFSELARINTELWHEVDKSFDIESLPVEKHAEVVKALASLNLIRTGCIDRIDVLFSALIRGT